ncbi:Hemopexin-like domain-containing protein [Aspergillus caelatus]|uniref:Hemopexin-like domain-containing protein n=2 Tax=Aspergillus subgen. Circumdati TaxID=2720871 RepID=A0A5N6ZV03_9EURO|nr:Hemopexin-like domain-containing protein [Aspergillus caelatus]KAE8361235.1 Hemopexin-like domain-containing protein [Aspergillus caelatus]KAE8423832.1 Hemopexin-like domain-containing protein [Aspergillus pseudocaelatus]
MRPFFWLAAFGAVVSALPGQPIAGQTRSIIVKRADEHVQFVDATGDAETQITRPPSKDDEYSILDGNGGVDACPVGLIGKRQTTPKPAQTPENIERTLKELQRRWLRQELVGRARYPHVFNNYERLPFPGFEDTQLYEFPLLPSTEPIYSGGSPGAVRILGAISSNGQVELAGFIRHPPGNRGGFELCPESAAVASTTTISPDIDDSVCEGVPHTHDENRRAIQLDSGMVRRDASDALRRLCQSKQRIGAGVQTGTDGEVWFFRGDEYIRYSTNDESIHFRKKISDGWPGLRNTPFSEDIDAAVKTGTSDEYWLFKGDEYVRYSTNGEKIHFRKKIVEGWPGLKGTPFIQGIDAVIRSETSGELWFFKGDEYVRYSTDDEMIHFRKKIVDGWPGLKDTPFVRDIDAAVKTGTSEEYWFFKGNEYVRYSTEDERIHFRKTIASGWPGLKNTPFSRRHKRTGA